MNQRLIIAMILAILVLFLYQGLVDQKTKKKVPSKEGAKVEQQVEERRFEPKEEVAKAVTRPRLPLKKVSCQDVVVDTPLYTATFTTYGGRLKSWKLKGYKDRVPMHPLGRYVQNLVRGVLGRKKVEKTPAKPVDIVNTTALDELPLGIRFRRGGIGYDEGIPFVSSSKGIKLRHEGEEGVLTLHWRSPAGEQIEKRFKFYAGSYRLDMEVVVSNSVNPGLVKDTLELEWIGKVEKKKGYYGFFGPIYYTDGGLEKIKPKKIKGEGKAVKEMEWFAYNEDYFISLIYPSIKGTRLILSRVPEDVIHNVLLTPMDIRPGEKGMVSYTLFLGPKLSHLLSQIAPTAKKAVDYGWFSIIAVPILKILSFTNKFTGNYGLDIIILALFLKILFTPLTHKSQESMKEMQKLQPEIKKLQQKYKNDKQRLNKEIMEMYKRRKVNPFSGCFPMLLQLPVFFALYRAFLNSIELRHSPFIWWIRDLADKDPTYIAPLLMGGTMYLQQKMTTAPTADPAQSKMMSLMPIFFTFIFLNFPSGLVLYWLVTNVLTIGHQFYINRKK
ncbi:MAG: membrane protein insertase YidC [Deltaproteobacteria bacterium]|nr:membrane protein insertase YidC [Deltaproteobacteria bacterium]